MTEENYYVHDWSDDKPKSLDDTMSAHVENDVLILRLPLEVLVWSQENREDALSILDRNAMAKWLINNIMDFSYSGGIKDSSDFEDLIDNAFLRALEDGETWLNNYDEFEDVSE